YASRIAQQQHRGRARRHGGEPLHERILTSRGPRDARLERGGRRPRILTPGLSSRRHHRFVAALALPAGAIAAVIALSVPAGAGATRGPACAPPALNRSAARAGGAVTVSPLPGSVDASYRSQISFVGASAARLTVTAVVGSRS